MRWIPFRDFQKQTGEIEMNRYTRIWLVVVIALSLGATASLGLTQEDNEQPLGAAVVNIETTDNDIELQVFVDGSPTWKHLQIEDPNERRIFNLKTQRRLRQQGMSELFFASSPDAFPADENGEIDPDGIPAVVEEFLDRFPAGPYEMEATSANGELEGEGILTHVIPALPVIVAPVSDTDEPLIVDPKDLVIDWEPVTTRFIGEGTVEIIEYQVILDQVDPLRAAPWVDGGTRRALINLTGNITQLTVPPEFLTSNSAYEFEVLAIEKSGNSTIAVGEFVTPE